MRGSSGDRVTLRALGRATLARQMLLARDTASPARAVERLVAMQAQLPRPPFVGLWSRVEGFRRDDLARALHARELVRGTGLRGTLHVTSARDYLALRGAIQPALADGMRAVLRARLDALDVDAAMAKARAFFGERPRSFDALRTWWAEREGGDARAVAYVVRMQVPLVQVPTPAERWAFPSAADFALAESWLGRAPDSEDRVRELAVRYLAAFGPATATDMQAWSGLKHLKSVMDALRPELLVLRDERGRELFDLPSAPRPPEDTPAPPRFLPEFDNLLLSHADRRRIVADEHRAAVYLPALRVAATFLVDGQVAGTWAVARAKGKATLTLTPWGGLGKKTREALAGEADRLVRFLEEDGASFDVSFAPARG